jgi:acyl carrier protein
MSNEEIVSTTKMFLVEEFEVNEADILPSASLKDTLDLDSLDYVDLVVLIDSHFGFKVEQQDFVGMVTFQDFYNFIIKKVNK